MNHKDFFKGKETIFNRNEKELVYTTVVNIAVNVIKFPGKQKDLKGFYLNKHLLFIAVESALVDLSRMAAFHLPDSLPDRHKYGGFFCYWINKIRPVQLVEGFIDDKESYFINAKLAISVMRRFLAPKEGKFDKPALESLEYIGFFREEKPENYALMAYLLEKPVNEDKLKEMLFDLPSL